MTQRAATIQSYLKILGRFSLLKIPDSLKNTRAILNIFLQYLTNMSNHTTSLLLAEAQD